ncbi:hypothetical protein BMS3Bbin03_02344 [bacterium BMS3Bbin03]|nr:hypothetical protein BMS3Bbin03_02344 [bacterium BMS3Bbin03]
MKRQTHFFTVSLLTLILFFTFFSADAAFAKVPPPHRFFIGGSSGFFRISARHFSRYYGSAWIFLPQPQLGFGLSPSAYLIIKGSQFTRKRTAQQTPAKSWRQQWLEFGFRRYSRGFSGKSRTFMGFGLALFRIEEKNGTFLREIGGHSGKVNPRGFYIEIGFEHFWTNSVSLSFEMDLNSAGLYGNTALQTQSVGGLFIGTGVKIFIF